METSFDEASQTFRIVAPSNTNMNAQLPQQASSLVSQTSFIQPSMGPQQPVSGEVYQAPFVPDPMGAPMIQTPASVQPLYICNQDRNEMHPVQQALSQPALVVDRNYLQSCLKTVHQANVDLQSKVAHTDQLLKQCMQAYSNQLSHKDHQWMQAYSNLQSQLFQLFNQRMDEKQSEIDALEYQLTQMKKQMEKKNSELAALEYECRNKLAFQESALEQLRENSEIKKISGASKNEEDAIASMNISLDEQRDTRRSELENIMKATCPAHEDVEKEIKSKIQELKVINELTMSLEITNEQSCDHLKCMIRPDLDLRGCLTNCPADIVLLVKEVKKQLIPILLSSLRKAARELVPSQLLDEFGKAVNNWLDGHQGSKKCQLQVGKSFVCAIMQLLREMCKPNKAQFIIDLLKNFTKCLNGEVQFEKINLNGCERTRHLIILAVSFKLPAAGYPHVADKSTTGKKIFGWRVRYRINKADFTQRGQQVWEFVAFFKQFNKVTFDIVDQYHIADYEQLDDKKKKKNYSRKKEKMSMIHIVKTKKGAIRLIQELMKHDPPLFWKSKPSEELRHRLLDTEDWSPDLMKELKKFSNCYLENRNTSCNALPTSARTIFAKDASLSVKLAPEQDSRKNFLCL